MKQESETANKVFIITGASSGIGRELAIKLASESTQLVLVGRNSEELNTVKELCAAKGPTPKIALANLALENDCAEIIRTSINEFSRIDGLLCVAGQAMKGQFSQAENAQSSVDIMNINYNSVVYMCHYALPHLLKSKGHLLTVAGLVGHVGVPGYSAYAASKHAIVGFTRALRRELSPRDVAVTLVSPDTVKTNIRENMLDPSGCTVPEAYGEESTMSAAQCAVSIINALHGRKKELVLGRTKFLQTMQSLLPGILDKILKPA